MGNMAIAFIFPAPDDPLTLGRLIAMAKAPFVTIPEVTVHMAVDEAAETVKFFLNEGELPSEIPYDSGLVAHADRELRLLGETDEEYISGMLKCVRAFAEMGHSGESASIARPTLHDLLSFKNLSELTDDPDEWVHHTEEVWGEPGGIWQNSRNGEAFSKDGGKTYYLLSEGGNDLNPAPLHESKKKG